MPLLSSDETTVYAVDGRSFGTLNATFLSSRIFMFRSVFAAFANCSSDRSFFTFLTLRAGFAFVIAFALAFVFIFGFAFVFAFGFALAPVVAFGLPVLIVTVFVDPSLGATVTLDFFFRGELMVRPVCAFGLEAGLVA